MQRGALAEHLLSREAELYYFDSLRLFPARKSVLHSDDLKRRSPVPNAAALVEQSTISRQLPYAKLHYLVYHRAEDGVVQMHRLDLASGASVCHVVMTRRRGIAYEVLGGVAGGDAPGLYDSFCWVRACDAMGTVTSP